MWKGCCCCWSGMKSDGGWKSRDGGGRCRQEAGVAMLGGGAASEKDIFVRDHSSSLLPAALTCWQLLFGRRFACFAMNERKGGPELTS